VRRPADGRGAGRAGADALRELATIVTGDRDLLVLQEVGIDVITIGELAAALGASR
jgi:hypothetical protein